MVPWYDNLPSSPSAILKDLIFGKYIAKTIQIIMRDYMETIIRLIDVYFFVVHHLS